MYTVDASVWVNGFDQREEGHQISRQVLDLLKAQRLPVIVPPLVLVEVAGAISRTRQTPQQAQEFTVALRNLPNVTLLPLDEALTQAPWRWLRSTVCAGRMRSMPPPRCSPAVR